MVGGALFRTTGIPRVGAMHAAAPRFPKDAVHCHENAHTASLTNNLYTVIGIFANTHKSSTSWPPTTNKSVIFTRQVASLQSTHLSHTGQIKSSKYVLLVLEASSQGTKRVSYGLVGGILTLCMVFNCSHLAKRLKSEGHYIVACDWKRNEHMPVRALVNAWQRCVSSVDSRCLWSTCGPTLRPVVIGDTLLIAGGHIL